MRFVIFFFANPKSPIFTTPLLSIMLAGLRSLYKTNDTYERFPL
jgi:hypothetical protein